MKLSYLPDWVQVKWDAALQENPNLIGILGPWELPHLTASYSVRKILVNLGTVPAEVDSFSSMHRSMKLIDAGLERSWLLLDESP